LNARQIPCSTPRISGVTYKDATTMFWFARKSKILDDVSKRKTIGPLECTHLPKQMLGAMVIPYADTVTPIPLRRHCVGSEGESRHFDFG
jgi:hypothetical protein